jgi:hypothetical protein
MRTATYHGNDQDAMQIMAHQTEELLQQSKEIGRLTAALASCQTHDYRQIIAESDRYLRALETIANYSGKVEPALLLKYIAEAAINFGHETAGNSGG